VATRVYRTQFPKPPKRAAPTGADRRPAVKPSRSARLNETIVAQVGVITRTVKVLG